MKLVNLKDENIIFSTSYFDVPQPMPIYHSTEELWANAPADTYIFTDIKHIAEIFRMRGNQRFKELIKRSSKGPRPIFVATSETIIPEAFNNQGDIVYKLTNFEITLTDNCYVQLYDVIPVTPGVCHMITSAGIQAFYQDGTGGDLSAAVRPQFKSVRGWDRRFQRNKREQKTKKLVKNYTTSRSTMALDYKLLYYLLNPLSEETFLNTKKAAHATFDRQKGTGLLKDGDIKEIMSSERIQSLIYKEIQKIMPELLKTVKGDIGPSKVAVMLEKIANQAIDNPDVTVKDKLLAVSGILQVGYHDEGAVITTDIEKPALGAVVTPGLLGGQQLIQPGAVPAVGALAPYSDEDTEKKESSIQPLDELDPSNLKERITNVDGNLTEERKSQLMKDVDVFPDYVQESITKPHNPDSPLIEPEKK